MPSIFEDTKAMFSQKERKDQGVTPCGHGSTNTDPAPESSHKKNRLESLVEAELTVEPEAEGGAYPKVMKTQLTTPPSDNVQLYHLGEWSHRKATEGSFSTNRFATSLGFRRTFRFLWYSLCLLKKIVRCEDLVIMAFAPLTTWYCYEKELIFKVPFNIISISTIFPLSYAIKASGKRKNMALSSYGQFHSAVFQMFLAVKSWGNDRERRNQSTDEVHRIRVLLYAFIRKVREALSAPLRADRSHHGDPYEGTILALVTELSEFFMTEGNSHLGGGHISRVEQYVYQCHTAYEEMRNFKQYRTPVSLRAFGYVSVCLLGLLYGPYFARIAQAVSLAFAIVCAAIFSAIILALVNLDEILENSYDIDQEGEFIDMFVHDWQIESTMKIAGDDEGILPPENPDIDDDLAESGQSLEATLAASHSSGPHQRAVKVHAEKDQPVDRPSRTKTEYGANLRFSVASTGHKA